MRAFFFWTLAIAAIGWSLWLNAEPADPDAQPATVGSPASLRRRVWVCPVASICVAPPPDALEMFVYGSDYPYRLWSDLQPALQTYSMSYRESYYTPPRYLAFGVAEPGDETPEDLYRALSQLECRALERPVTFARHTKDWLRQVELERLLDQEFEWNVVEATPDEFLQQLVARLSPAWTYSFWPERPESLPRVTLVGRATLRQALGVARLATGKAVALLDLELHFHDAVHEGVGPFLCRVYPLSNDAFASLLWRRARPFESSGGIGLAAHMAKLQLVDALWEQLREAEDQAWQPAPLRTLKFDPQERTPSELAREAATQTGGAVALLARDVSRRVCGAAEAECEAGLRQALAPWELDCVRRGSLLIAGNARASQILDSPEFIPLAHLAPLPAESPPAGAGANRASRSSLLVFLRRWVSGATFRVGASDSPGIVVQGLYEDQGEDLRRALLSSDSPLARLTRALHFGLRSNRPLALSAALSGDDRLAMSLALDLAEPEEFAAIRPALLAALASGRLTQGDLYVPTGRLVRCFENPPRADLLAALEQMANAAPLSQTTLYVLEECASDNRAFQSLYIRLAPWLLAQWKDHPRLSAWLEQTLSLQEIPVARDSMKALIVARRASLQWVHCHDRETGCLMEIVLELLRDCDPDQRRIGCEILSQVADWPLISAEHRQEATLAVERLRVDLLVTEAASRALLRLRDQRN